MWVHKRGEGGKERMRGEDDLKERVWMKEAVL